MALNPGNYVSKKKNHQITEGYICNLVLFKILYNIDINYTYFLFDKPIHSLYFINELATETTKSITGAIGKAPTSRRGNRFVGGR